MLNGKELIPNPAPRVGRLDTLQAVRRELSRVYRDARTGKIDPQDGTRFAFILSSIAKLIESSDLEERIAKLEQQQKGEHDR